MKYTVLDTKAISVGFDDRATAEATREQLSIDNPDADWKIYLAATPLEDSALEALYALASMLLTESKVNPIATCLQITKLDGTIEDRSLVRIMNDARVNIDKIYELEGFN